MRLITTSFGRVMINNKLYVIIPNQEFCLSKKEAESLLNQNLAVIKETKLFNIGTKEEKKL